MRNGYQRYQCKTCDRKFNTTGNSFGKWNQAEHIGAVIDMYLSGMSYKQIAELIGRNFDLPEPSKATIYRWVQEYGDFAVDGLSDRRQLVLPVTSTIFAGRDGVIIRYGGTVDYRPTNQAIEAETYGRQDTGNGSGQGWDERAFSAQVAEWAIAVAGETGASVAHSAGSLRRGVGG